MHLCVYSNVHPHIDKKVRTTEWEHSVCHQLKRNNANGGDVEEERGSNTAGCFTAG